MIEQEHQKISLDMAGMESERCVPLGCICRPLALRGRAAPRFTESFRTTAPSLMQNQFTRPGMTNRLSSHAKPNYEAETASGLSGERLRKLANALWEECHD